MILSLTSLKPESLSSVVLSRLRDVPLWLLERARHVLEAVVHRHVRSTHTVSTRGPLVLHLVLEVADDVGAVLLLLLAVVFVHLLLLGSLGARVGLQLVLLLLSLEVSERPSQRHDASLVFGADGLGAGLEQVDHLALGLYSWQSVTVRERRRPVLTPVASRTYD